MLKILSHHAWRGFGADCLFLIDVSNNAHKVKKSHVNAASPTAVSSKTCAQRPIHTRADRQHCTETQTRAHPSRAARARGWHRCPHSSGTHCHHRGGLGSEGELSKEERKGRGALTEDAETEQARLGAAGDSPGQGPDSRGAGHQGASDRHDPAQHCGKSPTEGNKLLTEWNELKSQTRNETRTNATGH